MKKKAIITYLLTITLLLSACVYAIPEVKESIPSHSDTSPSSSETRSTLETEQFAVVSVGTDDYRYGPCNYREITLIINGEEISGMTLYNCLEEVEEVIIPEEVNGCSVVAIGVDTVTSLDVDPAFHYNKSIRRIVIPETVRFIGGAAFSGCTKLSDLTVPSSIKWIYSYAFSDCPGVTEIRITADMKLDQYSLFGAIGLSEVILEEGVTFFPALNKCSALIEINLPSSITHLGLDGSSGDDPYFSGSSVTFLDIPEGVTFMCGNFFDNSMMERIVIPTTLTDYEKSSFENCPLKEVFFRGTEKQCPQGLKTIFAELEVPLYYLSETEPTEEGNFWHYVDGEPVIW